MTISNKALAILNKMESMEYGPEWEAIHQRLAYGSMSYTYHFWCEATNPVSSEYPENYHNQKARAYAALRMFEGKLENFPNLRLMRDKQLIALRENRCPNPLVCDHCHKARMSKVPR